MTILNKISDEDLLLEIDSIIELYSKQIKDWKQNLKLDGKNIEIVNIQQVSWCAYYDEMRVQVKSIYDFLDMKVHQVRGKLFLTILKDSSKDYSDRAKERIIDDAPEYLKIYRKFLEIKELFESLQSIVDQFKNRAFIINNIVRIRTAALQDETLYYRTDP